MIIRKLANRDGLQIDNPQQALARLAAAGYQDVVIQSLHVINGDECRKIVRQVQAHAHLFFHLRLGTLLLTTHDDFEQLIKAMQAQMPVLADDERVVLWGMALRIVLFLPMPVSDHMLMTKTFRPWWGRRKLPGNRCHHRAFYNGKTSEKST